MNPAGNARLTAAIGLLVIAPVAVETATILLGVHTFMSVHVFVGLALLPAVLLKLASTGWRFVRYYTRSHAYVVQGPPRIAMRLIAPLFVAATLVLFGSGVAMGLLHGQSLQIARRLHGPASVVWLGLLGLHVLVYLRRALSTVEVPAQHRWVDLRHDREGHDRAALLSCRAESDRQRRCPARSASSSHRSTASRRSGADSFR